MIYSGFWRRFAAICLDGMFMLIPYLIVGLIMPYIGGVLLSLLFKPLFEASPLRGTPGKAIMGIAVVTEAGERITLKQAYIRYFCSLLSGFVCFLGYIISLFTEKKQTLHDIVAETVVIKQQPPEVNYFQVWREALKELYVKLSGDDKKISNISPAPTSEVTADVSKTIEDLHKLYQSGALTQEEYEKKKQELLNKI